MIDAVIFDMDGLLVDSERLGLTAMHACGLKQHTELPLDMIRKTLGSNAASSSAFYHTHFPSLDTDQLFHDYRDAMHALALEGKVPLKKGARELLAVLREAGIPCAVASSSGPDTIRLYLTRLDILDFFAVLVSGGKGIPSKPSPDIFLRAADMLGAKAENCLVLEDSINGVKAGRSAGMQVCMVPDLIPFTEDLQPYCDHVLPDLLAVIPLVKP